MNALQHWIQTPAAAAVGWTLVHFVWQGAVIALALALVLGALRDSRARYAAACASLAAMFAAPLATLELLWPAAVAPLAHGVHLAARVPWPPPAGAAVSAPAAANPWCAWLAPVWFAGVLGMCAWRAAGWFAARRIRTAGVCPPAPQWEARFAELATALRVARPVRLLESSLAEVPLAIGFLRPVILLPVGLAAGLRTGQVEALLLHELAHIRRADYLVNLLQAAIEGLLFYHPAVWWVSGVIRAERENCCDDIVVRVRGDARGYAATLASLETARSRPPQPLLAAVGGRLIHRVRRLTNPPQARAASAPLASAIVALATVAMALLLWHARPAAAAPPAQQPAPAAAPQAAAAPQQQKPVEHHLVEEIPTEPAPPPPLTGPYLKWMNEDVAYIITDAERAAFKRLQTDPEREHFIEQFWLRRDPTPGTPENEFKEEHYRRIAYANDHFASGIPGWKTDRGRIYIVYGPPDEIEDHAAAGASPHSQQWLYRYIEGVGRNVIVEFQANAAGEFRMTMDPRNVFASMEPGELYAIVEVQPDRTAMIRIPLGESGGLYVVYGQVMKDGALVETFQQESVMSDFRKGIALAPGKYQLIVATRNGRGEGKRGVVEFTVK